MDANQISIEAEQNIKNDKLRSLIYSKGLDGILLRRVSSFSWVTCGADSHINTASSYGAASLLITPTSRFLLTTNIEAPRFEKEEKITQQGWDLRVSPWYDENDQLNKLSAGLKLGTDDGFASTLDLSSEIAWMRSELTLAEGQRFRILSNLCAGAMRETTRIIQPGMTEFQIAALLAQSVESRGVQATVNLIATDERIYSFRHPLPTSKQLQRYAMLVLCGRKWGLVCSITRLIYFGSLPDELRKKAEATARIDAAVISATRPGNTMGEVFHVAQTAYAAAGYPNEWQLHHQGGIAGYEPREFLATPSSAQPVLVGQAYAWNPSITGTKSEDTILVGESENEVITHMAEWPTIAIQLGNQVIKRPAILEIE